jgi:sialic acid synthase SpsE
MSDKKLKIAGRLVGKGEDPYVILEAASNWLDLDRKTDLRYQFDQAIRMIDVAKSVGADAVKFQTFQAEKHVSKIGPTPKYLLKTSKKTLFEILKELEMPRDWFPRLADHCRKKKIHFLSTPNDYAAVDLLADDCGMPAVKISSFEIVDLELLRYAARKSLPMIVSAGLSDAEDIRDARRAIYATGNRQLAFLYCVIAYPPEIGDLNLNRIETLEKLTDCPIGWSDHSMSIVIPALAVAKGACIVEKHFTLSRKQRGPDHTFALEPHEARQMIENIRHAHKAMGRFDLGHIPAEDEMYRIGRRCIHFTADAKKGEILKKKHFIFRRGDGIPPKYLPKIVGKPALRDFKAEEILQWKWSGIREKK